MLGHSQTRSWANRHVSIDEHTIMTHTHSRDHSPPRPADPHFVFSSCFRYADLLQKKLAKHGTQCFLINTGWTGGGHGVGKRMSLKETRACVHAVLDGTIDKSTFTPDPVRDLLCLWPWFFWSTCLHVVKSCRAEGFAGIGACS